MRELMTRRISGEASRAVKGDGPVDRGATRLPLPDAPNNVETRRVEPIPRLELLLADAKLKPAYSWYGNDPRHRGSFKVPLARLAFDYDGELVAHV